MIRKALIAATILSGVCGRAYAESVTLDVTSPFMFQDTISVQYYVDAGPTCDTIEGSVSGSSGYYHEFGASGVSYLSGGDTDYLADTSVPNEIDYTLDAFWSYGNIESCGFPSSGSDYATAWPANPFYPPPTISGPNTVWWFDSQNPSGYATSVVLTSDAGSGTEWAIIQGSNKVQLSSTYGETVTVTPTGIISSGYVGDILITASALGSTSSPFAMTARRPYRLLAGTITDTCSPSFGYTSFLNYTIQDNLLDTMPTAAPLNEQWASGFVNDWPGGNNWTGRAQGSFTGVSFADRIDGEDVTIPANPMPGCGGNAALVRHWEQEWRVGSLATGVGRLVQTNTLEQHLDFGRHSNIRY